MRRLVNDERAHVCHVGIGSLRRHMRRETFKAATVDPSKLADQEKTVFLTNLAQLGAIRLVSTPAAAKRIEHKKAFTEQEAINAIIAIEIQ